MNRIAEKKNEKYVNIISAAFDLFKVKDISSVSIDEIVKKAGVAKGTFYLYFKDKFDLISKIILKKATEYLKLEVDVTEIKSDEDFNKCLEKYLEYLIFFLEKNMTLTALIDKNVDLCVNTVISNCEGPLKDLHDNIVEYFKNKGFTDDEVNIKMYIYIDMTVAACCNAILRKKPYSLDEIKPHLYEIITMSIFGAEMKKRQKND